MKVRRGSAGEASAAKHVSPAVENKCAPGNSLIVENDRFTSKSIRLFTSPGNDAVRYAVVDNGGLQRGEVLHRVKRGRRVNHRHKPSTSRYLKSCKDSCKPAWPCLA